MSYDALMSPLETFYLRTVRKKMMAHVMGKTLEIGVGSGANLPFYPQHQLTSLAGLDLKFPPTIRDKLETKMTLTIGRCENLPYPDQSFDTVVTTLTLCSVTDLPLSLKEIKRVLKDEGRYVFIEHVLPEKKSWQTLFKLANPLWQRATNGCQLTRLSDQEIQAAGFTVDSQKNPSGILCYGIAKKESI